MVKGPRPERTGETAPSDTVTVSNCLNLGSTGHREQTCVSPPNLFYPPAFLRPSQESTFLGEERLPSHNPPSMPPSVRGSESSRLGSPRGSRPAGRTDQAVSTTRHSCGHSTFICKGTRKCLFGPSLCPPFPHQRKGRENERKKPPLCLPSIRAALNLSTSECYSSECAPSICVRSAVGPESQSCTDRAPVTSHGLASPLPVIY